MKTSLSGSGTLRLNGGTEVVSSCMGATVCAVEGWHQHEVKIVVTDSRPEGCTMEIQVSAEDAAHFASAIYGLAKTAMIKADHDEDEAVETIQAAAA